MQKKAQIEKTEGYAENSHSKVRKITIDEGADQQRIDNFLLKNLKGVPKSHIYRLLRTGQVRVNKGRIKPVYRLKINDVVRIPPVKILDSKAESAVPQSLLASIEKAILYEDDKLIVVNKPSGLAVHGGSGIHFGLIEVMRALRPKCDQLELVHRLDRPTSGCLIIAKKRAVLKELHAMLRDKHIEKVYWALVKGRWPKKKLMVNGSLKKNTLKSGERVVRIDADGKPALTEFKMIQGGNLASLVEARPITGRTHQIRVHAQSHGHPLACDDKYGDDEFDCEMKKRGLSRLFLHSYSISFSLASGQDYQISCPLEGRLQQVLEKLG
jgi:23S rRNA pseudouridine955/2504/2580 synthase